MLKPVNSPTRLVEERRKAAIKEIEKNGTHGLLMNAKDAMVSTVTKFNEIYTILAGLKGEMSALCEIEARAYRELTPLIGGDISFIVHSEGCTAKEVEDERCFKKILQELSTDAGKVGVLARCVKIADTLGTCIESWKSKRDKLASRTKNDGTTDAEYEAIQKKLEQLNYVVSQLETRADTISQLFYTTANTLAGRIEKYRKDFHAKFKKGK